MMLRRGAKRYVRNKQSVMPTTGMLAVAHPANMAYRNPKGHSMAQQQFGFIGVGRMGGLMSARLLDAGHQVAIYDVAEEAVAGLAKKGARRMASAAEVAGVAETVFLSLPNPEIVQRAALDHAGIIEGTKVRHVVDFSTMARAQPVWSPGSLPNATLSTLMRRSAAG